MKNLKEILINFKKKRNKIVFTNGCFDIIHLAHIMLLKKAKSLGNELVVGLNSDSSVRELKGSSRPINNELDRKKVLESIKWVDKVIIFNELTPERLIKEIKPDILIKGGDYKENEIVGADIVKNNGGEVVIYPYIPCFSTTDIINHIKGL